MKKIFMFLYNFRFVLLSFLFYYVFANIIYHSKYHDICEKYDEVIQYIYVFLLSLNSLDFLDKNLHILKKILILLSIQIICFTLYIQCAPLYLYSGGFFAQIFSNVDLRIITKIASYIVVFLPCIAGIVISYNYLMNNYKNYSNFNFGNYVLYYINLILLMLSFCYIPLVYFLFFVGE